jgi:hypothetical protein
MIAEYEALRGARTLSETVSSNSSNLFLAAVSGAMIALGLIGQVDALKDQFFLASLVFLFGLLLVGFCTFARTLEGQIACRIYVRGMNRIRRYFVELAPNITNYLILPVSDDVPAFCSAGFSPSRWVAQFINPPAVVATINSIIGSVLITGILRASCNLYTQFTIFCCGAVVFIAMFIAHHTYQVCRLKKAEVKWETKVYFPSPKADK